MTIIAADVLLYDTKKTSKPDKVTSYLNHTEFCELGSYVMEEEEVLHALVLHYVH